MALQLTLFFKNIFIHIGVDARDLSIIGTLHSAHVQSLQDGPVSRPVDHASRPVDPVSSPVDLVSRPVDPVSSPVDHVSRLGRGGLTLCYVGHTVELRTSYYSSTVGFGFGCFPL